MGSVFDDRSVKRIVRTVLRDERRSNRSPERRERHRGRKEPFRLYAVSVTVDGGSAGGWSSTCSFTYTVNTLGGTELLTGATPDTERISNVEYASPSADSPGVAYKDADGTWHLYHVAEEHPQGKTVNNVISVSVSGGNLVMTRQQQRVLETDTASSPETIISLEDC